MYEIAIIGGGPAGVSAAINAKILNKDFIWFSSRAVRQSLNARSSLKTTLGFPMLRARNSDGRLKIIAKV